MNLPTSSEGGWLEILGPSAHSPVLGPRCFFFATVYTPQTWGHTSVSSCDSCQLPNFYNHLF